MLPVKAILTVTVFVVVAFTSVPARTGLTHTSDQADAVSRHSIPAPAATWRAQANAEDGRESQQAPGAGRTNAPSALTITCPANLTLQCHRPQRPSHTGAATATGRAPIRIDFEDTIRPGRCPNENAIARMWIATDAGGRTSTCVQTIWVVDSTPPEIAIPSDPMRHDGDTVAVDNCDPSPSFGFIDNTASGSLPATSVTTRIWTAVDACGNVNVESNAITARTPADGTARILGGERAD